MEVAFSGINIYSKKPEAVFEFYKKLGFRVLEEVAPDDKWYGSTLALQDGDNAPIIWIWRQSEIGKIGPESRDIFFPIDGFEAVNQEAILSAREELAGLCREIFGCAGVRTAFIDAGNNSVEL